MKYIFLFTLSPVQSFIAQARKTQDLYAGSRILSELTKVAAIEAKKHAINLVFPQNTEGVASFPNRFIGTIEGDFDEQTLQNKGKAVEDAVNAAFTKLAEDALIRIKYQNNVPNGFWEQIDSHLDINWLFHEIKNDDYKTAYKEIEPLMASLKNVRFISNLQPEALMASLKNVRFFSNFQPEAGRKCSLDGELNALFRGQNTKNKQLEKQAKEIDGNKTHIWLKPNEGLSAVSLVKRAYRRYDGQKEEFPSTAKVALSFQIEQLKKNTKKSSLYCCYEELFTKNYTKACVDLVLNGHWESVKIENVKDNWRTDFDDQFLFEENLTAENIPNLCQLNIAKEIQKQLKSDLTDKYYAIIAFDGDKMGELLSGERCENKPTNLAVFQGTVSQLLRDYAASVTDEKAKNYVWKDNIKPHVIYAGGDDFLGFVNLNHLFDVVEKLRTEFETQVNIELQKQYPLKKDFTFSMGIAIAHYKTPLSIVLQKARDLETLAKQKDKGNRDAFAIAALKHSGESHEAYFNWELKEGKLPKWDVLKKLVDYFQNDCSETFVRSLDREFYLFQQKDKIKIARRKISEVIVQNESEKDIQKHYYLFPELKRLTLRSMKENSKTDSAIIAADVWQLFLYETMLEDYVFYAQNALDAVKVALFLKKETKLDKKVKNGN